MQVAVRNSDVKSDCNEEENIGVRSKSSGMSGQLVTQGDDATQSRNVIVGIIKIKIKIGKHSGLV